MSNFIGRQAELNQLNSLLKSKTASFVVMNGRRRIGKSRLIEEFAKPYSFYKFQGLAPHPDSRAQDQRNEFMRQFADYFNLPLSGVNDWGTLFSLLARQTAKQRAIILLDEISWMADDDVLFLSKLKTIWDDEFSKNSKLILFICGSVSYWIEKNLLSSTAFLGRPTLQMTLGELTLTECNKFWGHNKNISAFEKFKSLAITGGVPRYLELLNPNEPAENNIQRLFFNKESALVNEYQKIFEDIYGKKSERYSDVIQPLLTGPKTQTEINSILKKFPGGDVSQHLNELILGGFVKRDHTWHLKTHKISKLSQYRLSDNYLRFCLKYIEKNKMLIEKGRFKDRELRTLPGWDSMLGLQFENCVINNADRLLEILNIKNEAIIFDNPYFQRKTQRQQACQVDYLIQTRHDTVYVCEIKFKRKEIGLEIIEEMKDKLDKITIPKYVSKRPVLIHINGVHDEVIDSRYFYRIINFSDFLHKASTGLS